MKIQVYLRELECEKTDRESETEMALTTKLINTFQKFKVERVKK